MFGNNKSTRYAVYRCSYNARYSPLRHNGGLPPNKAGEYYQLISAAVGKRAEPLQLLLSGKYHARAKHINCNSLRYRGIVSL